MFGEGCGEGDRPGGKERPKTQSLAPQTGPGGTKTARSTSCGAVAPTDRGEAGRGTVAQLLGAVAVVGAVRHAITKRLEERVTVGGGF